MAGIITDASKEKNFLLFHTANNWQIKQTIQNLLYESFGSKNANREIIKAYMTILFTRLLESDSYEMFITEIIKHVTGSTFSSLIHEQKFRHAALQLKLTDRTIEEIPKEIGYNNLTFFYRKFHALHGVTPNEYRELSKQDEGNPD